MFHQRGPYDLLSLDKLGPIIPMDIVPIVVLVHGLLLMTGECGNSFDVREALVDMDLLNHLPQ
jgi:hypothetical protein